MLGNVVAIIKSPHLFTFVILTLHACSIVRYVVAQKYGNALYWASAFCMTVAATFFMGRK